MRKENIIITVFTLALCSGTFAQRHVIPLEYVAEYNLGTDTKTGAFASNQQADSCGFYTPDEARNVCPKGYHIPSVQEIYSIIPPNKASGLGISFNTSPLSNQPEEVEFGGMKRSFTADYMSKDHIIYGLRFQGYHDEFLSAYRYERIGMFGEAGIGDINACLLIQAKYLGPTFSGSIETIANEDFWKTDDIVTRILPANGWKRSPSSQGYDLRMGGMMTLVGGDFIIYIMEFGDYEMSVVNQSVRNAPAGVRPFLNKLPENPVYSKPKQKVYTSMKGINRPLLPIEKMAKTNVGKTDKTFAKDNDADNTGLYLISEKNSQYPVGYHGPTMNEWRGVFPEKMTWDNGDRQYSYKELIQANGVMKNYDADYLFVSKGRGKRTCYGLKFKGEDNQLLSAYKYEFDEAKPYIKITCRYLGPTFDGIVQDLNRSDNFWELDDTITVLLPYCGIRNSDRKDAVENKNEEGHYWVQDTGGMVSYRIGYSYMYKNSAKNVYGYALRLFRTGNSLPKTDDTNTKPATTTTKRPVAKPATTTKRPVVKQQITNVKK